MVRSIYVTLEELLVSAPVCRCPVLASRMRRVSVIYLMDDFSHISERGPVRFIEFYRGNNQTEKDQCLCLV